jgi:heme-degrading monooxygenase HmoA
LTSDGYHLAQVNIARFRKPIEDPANADFVNALDSVNTLAETSPGFVWRLTGEGDNATDLKAFDDPQIAIKMSLWESLEALGAFVYRNLAHRGVMRRRREWFEEMPVYMALWWVRAGVTPSIADAKARLALLEQLGPTAEAFTFRQPFAAPSGDDVAPVLDACA